MRVSGVCVFACVLTCVQARTSMLSPLVPRKTQPVRRKEHFTCTKQRGFAVSLWACEANVEVITRDHPQPQPTRSTHSRYTITQLQFAFVRFVANSNFEESELRCLKVSPNGDVCYTTTCTPIHFQVFRRSQRRYICVQLAMLTRVLLKGLLHTSFYQRLLIKRQVKLHCVI